MPEMCWQSSNNGVRHSVSEPDTQRNTLLLLNPVAVQNFFGVIVFDLGRVPQNFIVGSLEQLLTAIEQLAMDCLLDTRV